MRLAKVAFRNIRRNRRRSLLSGTAIAVATMAITCKPGRGGGKGKRRTRRSAG